MRRRSSGSRRRGALRGRAREVGDDHHAEGLGREDEDDVDGVGVEEAVRLGVAAELVGEKGARARRREATTTCARPVSTPLRRADVLCTRLP